MSFYPSKCEILRITMKRKSIVTPYMYTYNIHEQPLVLVQKGKFLGVTILKNHSWNDHVDSTAKKTNISL